MRHHPYLDRRRRSEQQYRDDTRMARIITIRKHLRAAEALAKAMHEDGERLEDLDLRDELRRVRERHLDWAEEAGLEEGAG